MYYKKFANLIIKIFFNGIGFFLLMIGIIGIILPIIPGIPFLIAAGLIFYKIDVNSKISLNLMKFIDKAKTNKFISKLRIKFAYIKEKI